MAKFKTVQDVQEWVDANGGVEQLRLARERGAFGLDPTTNLLITGYLERHDRRIEEAHAADERKRREREVKSGRRFSRGRDPKRS